ncbi:hypothetical protein CYMTET_28874 [Cymbomonas tetramitiformis]|uniref:DNA-directed RNA polymerase n=1 Tax=Cymbomonas tetramitiformis TaxID=36881 RepID=A0AAE0FMD6_9CHLO|nr:hypothetical protein CYMTET_28874 [Cymbomonas tetramitiformis]
MWCMELGKSQQECRLPVPTSPRDEPAGWGLAFQESMIDETARTVVDSTGQPGEEMGEEGEEKTKKQKKVKGFGKELDADVAEDSDSDDEEGAKTEGRREARGRGGEAYAAPDDEEHKADSEMRTVAMQDIAIGVGAGDAEEGPMTGQQQEEEDADEKEDEEEEDVMMAEPSPKVKGKSKGKEKQQAKAKPKAKKPRAIPKAKKQMLAPPDVDVDWHTGVVCLSFELNMQAPKVLLLEVAENVAAEAEIRATKGIKNTFVVEKDTAGDGGAAVQTDGLNFAKAWEQQHLVDVNNIRTNHIFAMLETYGIEAARATLIAEVKGVFGAYGITVDPRHLSLIGDYMTFQEEGGAQVRAACRRRVLGSGCVLPAEEAWFGLRCVLPGKEEGFGLRCVLPVQEEGFGLRCVLPAGGGFWAQEEGGLRCVLPAGGRFGASGAAAQEEWRLAQVRAACRGGGFWAQVVLPVEEGGAQSCTAQMDVSMGSPREALPGALPRMTERRGLLEALPGALPR